MPVTAESTTDITVPPILKKSYPTKEFAVHPGKAIDAEMDEFGCVPGGMLADSKLRFAKVP
jgi:hypothetical protein